VTPTLSLRDVRKAYGTQVVLDGVDLGVAAGEVVAIAGRSGSGKTTLLAIVTGWCDADGGAVDAHPGERWHELAVLPQALGLLDELTVEENIGLPLRLAPELAADDPGALMARLGIDHLAGRQPDECSLGEQQRAALARAAVVRPALLVADEPVSHQNREWAEQMMLLVRDLAAQGTACVLATHDAIAFEHADRVLDLRDGRLVARAGQREL
jgi:putative ABC transport system ATP-binding protein